MRKATIVVLASTVIAAPLLAACSDSGPAGPGAGSHAVVYKVTGTGGVTIQLTQMQSTDGKASTDTIGATLPWTKSLTVNGDLSEFGISVTGGDSAISCEVSVDGKVASSKTGTGRVSCSGTGLGTTTDEQK